MITYYELLENGLIGNSTTDLKTAQEANYTLQTEEEIVAVSLAPGMSDLRMLQSQFEEYKETAEYKKQDRLKEIKQQLAEIEQQANDFTETPITYVNGKEYKPKWADSGGVYWTLLQADDEAQKLKLPSTFPMTIWDATELESNAVVMTRQELTQLILFLVNSSTQAFAQKKQTISALKAELEELENG